MMKKTSLFALSAISFALAGCGSDSGEANQPGSLTLSGTAKEGEQLTASVNDPDGIDPNTLAFTWFADGNVIANAMSATYLLSVNEAGANVRVSVMYLDNGNTREGFTSNETATVEALPINIDGVITVSGSATIEQTLTVAVSDGDGIAGDVAYSWAADGTDIDGETGTSLVITDDLEGSVITATATYTDDEGFAETLTSVATKEVAPIPQDNVAGTLDDPVTGLLEVNATLTAPTPVDANGISGDITYQWQSREPGTDITTAVDVAGATSSALVVAEIDLGKILSVNLSYKDDLNFDEALTQSAVDEIFSFYVQGETSLAAALTNAMETDTIGIASVADPDDDYTDMAELTLGTNGLTIALVEGSDAIISGTTCIAYGGDTSNITIDGLVFDELIIPVAGSCGEGRGSIVIDGTNNIIRNSSFLGDTGSLRTNLSSSDESHYISISGMDNIIERNLFTGKSVNEGEEGSAISMFIGVGDDVNTVGDHQRNLVQYNLFKDIVPTFIVDEKFDTDSGSHAVQVGRSGSEDGAGKGDHVVQYNRFDTALYDRGLIVVQGGGNTIHGNTIVNSWGNIELRNGYGNTVSNNIIIASGADYVATVDNVEGSNNKDGGIAFTPLGHSIVDNYVANLSTDSSDRAGLHIDSDSIDSGNSSTQTIIDSGLDLSTVIARNTVLNTRNAIQFEDSSARDGADNCTNLDYTLDFDDNLIANQSAENNIFGTTSGDGATAIKQDEYPAHGCALSNASDYDDNHIYSEVISDLTPIMAKRDNTSLTDGADGNVLADGTEDGASLSAPDGNNLVEGTGADAGVGVALSELVFMEEDMVGPGSTWEAPAVPE